MSMRLLVNISNRKIQLYYMCQIILKKNVLNKRGGWEKIKPGNRTTNYCVRASGFEHTDRISPHIRHTMLCVILIVYK